MYDVKLAVLYPPLCPCLLDANKWGLRILWHDQFTGPIQENAGVGKLRVTGGRQRFAGRMAEKDRAIAKVFEDWWWFMYGTFDIVNCLRPFWTVWDRFLRIFQLFTTTRMSRDMFSSVLLVIGRRFVLAIRCAIPY